MVICPNCRHSELQGALFCSQCGALLTGVIPRTTQAVKQTTGHLKTDQASMEPVPAIELQAPVTLYVIDSGQFLLLENGDEFTLGRSGLEQPISPDVDLTPYQGYEMGVSRLHALIRLEDKQVVVMDLGSVNGTRLNSVKIPPHKPCALNHGDILALGKLKIQVLIRG
jgi:hypothetical protein